MAEIKSKKPVRRRTVSAGNSPAPAAPEVSLCGHSGCGRNCNVRYVGATSPISNHHILHAARGVSHVWTAAVVAGLAVVITGAVAFNAAQAASDSKTANGQLQVRQDVGRELVRMNKRLDDLQAEIKSLNKCQLGGSGSDTSTAAGQDGAVNNQP